MNLFGMGSLEVLVILLVGFLVLGPSRLLGLAKGMGKITREFRNATSQITRIADEETDVIPPKDDDPEERP